jgi:membrane-bound lytic murein transglycosylase B
VFWQIFTVLAGRIVAEGRRTGPATDQAIRERVRAGREEIRLPPPVITAFWALESDFGAVRGNPPTLRSLVSLGL